MADASPAAAAARRELEELLRRSERSYVDGRAARWHAVVDGRPILLFGPGQNGRMVAHAMRESGRPAQGFVSDVAEAHGTAVEGLPVLSPAVAVARFGRGAAVVVTPFTPGHSYRRTRARLTDAGFAAASIFEAVGATPGLSPFYFFDAPQVTLDHADALRALFARLLDDRSRRELVEHVRFRLTADPSNLLEPIGASFAYFLDLFDPPVLYVDGGAYDGDTVRAFIASFGDGYERIEAFEPDERNFAALECYRDGLPLSVRSRIAIHRKGLWREDGCLGFASTGTLASSLSAAQGANVEVTTVDAVLGQAARGLVKLDVEGAEGDAIDGAQDAIRSGRAMLAVAVYHTPEDLWRLPERVLRHNPALRFALRSHADDGADLMLYALPPDAASRTATPTPVPP